MPQVAGSSGTGCSGKSVSSETQPKQGSSGPASGFLCHPLACSTPARLAHLYFSTHCAYTHTQESFFCLLIFLHIPNLSFQVWVNISCSNPALWIFPPPSPSRLNSGFPIPVLPWALRPVTLLCANQEQAWGGLCIHPFGTQGLAPKRCIWNE